MDNFDYENYDLVETIDNNTELYKDYKVILEHLSKIINDRSIPEIQKHYVKSQYDKIINEINILSKPPTLSLKKKEE